MRRTVMLAAFLVGSVLGTSPVIGRAQSGGATLQSGIEALKASDFGRAERIFLELLKKDATASNYAYLAMAESSTGHLDQALDHFRRSLRLGNDSAVLHYYFGLAYLKNHENSAGIRELQLATLRDAKFGPARSALGVALLNAGRPREAIPHLEQARALFPEDAEVWASLVRAKFEAGEPKEAIQSADTAMEAIPDDARLPATLASCAYTIDNPRRHANCWRMPAN